MELELQKLEKEKGFQELVYLLKKPNIFNVLKLNRYEIRHSNFLAWLMNPKENHLMGSSFLDLFLSDLLSSDIIYNKGNFKSIKRETICDIDIFIEFDHLVIAIENKFYSNEHSNQLEKYKNYVEDNFSNKQRIFVYLTPKGKQTLKNNEYLIYSYEFIVDHLNTLLKSNKDISPRTKIYLEDYIHSVQATIMKTNPENLLASQLYNKYKDVFDFVMLNTNSDINFVTHQANLLLTDLIKGYVKGSEDYMVSRFTTTNIYSILKPINGKRRIWKNNEPLLFELTNEKEDNKISFLISVSNFNNKLSEVIFQLFNDNRLKCMNPERSWRTFNMISFPFDFTRHEDLEYIKVNLQIIIKNIIPIIDRVEKIVEENKETLLDCY